MRLPVRVELQDESYKSCSFTIYEEFLDYPVYGDCIVIPSYGYLSVTRRFHYCVPGEKASLMVVTSVKLVKKHDDMLKLLDWFKDHYEIEAFKASSDPAPYYSFYRSTIRLLGWKTSERLTEPGATNTKLKVFSAGAAAVLVAETVTEDLDYAGAYSQINPHIEQLLQIVLEKRRAGGGEVDLLDAVKTWEASANPKGDLKWEASEEQVLDAARLIFKRFKSIPPDMLPDGL